MNVEVWPRRASRACLIGNAGTLVVVDWGRVTAQNLMIENLMKPNLLKKSSPLLCLSELECRTEYGTEALDSPFI